MKKIRLTLTQVIEYTPNPEHYPDCNTIEEMAKYDAKVEDINELFDNESTKVNVSWEIIDSEEKL